MILQKNIFLKENYCIMTLFPHFLKQNNLFFHSICMWVRYHPVPVKTETSCSWRPRCCPRHTTATGSDTAVQIWSRCPRRTTRASNRSPATRLWAASPPHTSETPQAQPQSTWSTANLSTHTIPENRSSGVRKTQNDQGVCSVCSFYAVNFRQRVVKP